MLKTFDCPKCGAPVQFESSLDPDQTKTTLRCAYCHSQLLAPNELTGRPAQVVRIQVGFSPGGGKFPKWVLVLLIIPVLGLIVGILAAVGALAPLFYSGKTSGKEPDKPVRFGGPTGPGGPKDSKEKTNGFASVLLDFGREGIGPGMFTDARSIAVDGDGRIYVGEYTGGRIQVFDPEGKFVSQWNFGDRKSLLRGLAADRKGTVYVVTGGNIVRYRGERGEKLGEVAYESSGFDDVSVGADGGFVTAWHRNRDDIVAFDSNGKSTLRIPAAISTASGDSELNMRVAVDGSGYIYALGTFNEAIFKFGRDGKFVTRFGGEGDQPGQFRAPYSLAVDGFGRVYVGDFKGIQVFDSDGRYLQTISVKNVAFGMVFNDKNELFVVARDHVVKYAVQAP